MVMTTIGRGIADSVWSEGLAKIGAKSVTRYTMERRGDPEPIVVQALSGDLVSTGVRNRAARLAEP